MKNKYSELVINHYNNYEEDERFNTKHQIVEFLTTMKYIKKYAKKGCKILEIGAGTGRYSIALAKMGYDVTAVELVENNLKVLKENSKNVKNIKSYQGDVLDLQFEDNSFDVVLCLGPMYHLYNKKDKMQAIKETIRVCKHNGICMFAYLTHASLVWAYSVRKNCFGNLKNYLLKDGAIKDEPKEIFSSFYVEDFKKLFENTNTKYLTTVATDGIFPMMRNYIDDVMSEEDYNELLKWHYATCEREDQLGYSSHILHICKKIK